jgi:hypothetical protein
MRDKVDFLPIPVSSDWSSSKRFFNPRRLWRELSLKYFCSLDAFPLGCFTSATAALAAHKALIIWLHRPLPKFKLLLLCPFLFAFDFASLLALHRAFSSRNQLLRAIASLTSLLITLCSAGFASYYSTVNAEINWGRSIKV